MAKGFECFMPGIIILTNVGNAYLFGEAKYPFIFYRTTIKKITCLYLSVIHLGSIQRRWMPRKEGPSSLNNYPFKKKKEKKVRYRRN